MNIGIFTDTYFPQINGVATSTMTLFEELRKMGHNVYIFTPNDVGVEKDEKYINRLPSMRFVFSKNHRMTFIYPPKLLLKFRKLKLDIIHTQTEFPIGFLGLLVSDFYNIPIVHTYHTMYEDYVHYILNGHLITKNGAKKFSRVFCNRTNHIIAPVEKTKFALLEYGVKRDISIIPTGLYLDRYLNDIPEDELLNIKKDLGILETNKVCMFLGRVAKEKSIDVIIKEFPKVLEKEKNAILLIVGGGPYLNDLQDLADSLNLRDNIIFTDFIPNKEIHKYYKLGDVFITASTSETQGLTYIEAMASKVPVIVKKDESVNNVITHNENGYVFSNDSDLSGLIIDLLNDTNKQKTFIEKSLSIAKKYNANTFANEVLNVYNQATKEYEAKKMSSFIRKARGKIT